MQEREVMYDGKMDKGYGKYEEKMMVVLILDLMVGHLLYPAVHCTRRIFQRHIMNYPRLVGRGMGMKKWLLWTIICILCVSILLYVGRFFSYRGNKVKFGEKKMHYIYTGNVDYI
ncbi:hypothetical protein [Thermotalea metallivorans]|uniref:Uncharacterized protein n=1 Tax=Thermotalea metallivorans TaxID=520762 RepID=A0A140L2G6_9FIRM|nr:hypothetical protein [Thermotalea metallivorans]KXG74741.1 hypothetical protein AN619_20810 [Thermotalea metallivorans]